MTDLNNLLSPLFLDEKEIKKLIELIFFSYREFTTGPDKVLEKIQLGRAHHRIIYFVGKQKKITIKELLKILKITKQSLSRVLNQLVKKNYIIVTVGNDKRTKNLSLTQKGNDLEKELTTIQITRIKNIIKHANENEINGFKKILYSMIDSEGQKIFNSLNKI
jgi:DNA-binding MarR family transcriptional regulator